MQYGTLEFNSIYKFNPTQLHTCTVQQNAINRIAPCHITHNTTQYGGTHYSTALHYTTLHCTLYCKTQYNT